MINEFIYSDLMHAAQLVCEPFPAAALTTTEGDALYIKPFTPADLGTLSAAAQTTFRYLQLQSGEMALMNDPYSGGSILSTMTLIMGIKADSQKKSNDADLLLCARVPFKPKIHLTDSIEAEGLRIPPTPILQKGVLNRELLDVIASHPECPNQFESYINRTIEQMKQEARRLSQHLSSLGMDFSKKSLKTFFDTASSHAHQALGELAIGEGRDELLLEDNSKICLRMEVVDGSVTCDFTGTLPSRRYHLTDAATFGAAAAAVFSYLDADIPYNQGTLSTVHIVAPEGSAVNSKYPAPVFLGMTDGAELILSLVIRLLNKIDKRRSIAQSGVSQCAFHIEFDKNTYFYDYLQPGAAGTKKSAGLSGIEMWKRSHLRPSVEEVERRYPLIVRSSTFRHKSGGGGSNAGGDGITKVFQILKPGLLKWKVTDVIRKPEGTEGGKSGMGPEIVVMDTNGEKVKMADEGQHKLNENDQVIIHSSGGGGFGE